MRLAPKRLLSLPSPRSLLLNPNPNRPLSSSSSSSPAPNPDPNPSAGPRGLTPLEQQFANWVERLRPGFTGADVAAAVRAAADPDLALDLFRWASLRPGYRHPPEAYLAALSVAASSGRLSAAETLVSDVLSGACPVDLPLFNAAVRFCCSRPRLLPRAFDLFNKLRRSPGHRPSLDTYNLLLSALLRRIGRPPAAHAYLHAVRSLARHMKASGVVPDSLALNLIIKAHARCLDIDGALRVFSEMPLYGCDPNEFSYGYVVKALCEKGRVDKAMAFLREMRGKALVPTASVYMAAVSSLALERRFEEAVEVVLDMLGNGRAPDLLTYRTLLEEMCRGGRADDAFQLLDELSRRRGAMDRRTYSDLLEGLHWICQPVIADRTCSNDANAQD
ncbi:Pentatricopeptide repeat-containing protein, mitochondrial [Ananas comosus]|uniref:Pentatricopeptide repeat-containing protein, mitochondrial n=1 Tax=Ananas comosus TaxID=4615 RepID=A0A199UXM5_ANACO|nr:Pentatricopeptide repeat-containing protein, mitochondrial [Ananas comosus]